MNSVQPTSNRVVVDARYRTNPRRPALRSIASRRRRTRRFARRRVSRTGMEMNSFIHSFIRMTVRRDSNGRFSTKNPRRSPDGCRWMSMDVDGCGWMDGRHTRATSTRKDAGERIKCRRRRPWVDRDGADRRRDRRGTPRRDIARPPIPSRASRARSISGSTPTRSRPSSSRSERWRG